MSVLNLRNLEEVIPIAKPYRFQAASPLKIAAGGLVFGLALPHGRGMGRK